MANAPDRFCRRCARWGSMRLTYPTLHDREFKKLIGQEQAPITDSTFTAALELLAALHSEGKLSDDEFRAAKKRLLSA